MAKSHVNGSGKNTIPRLKLEAVLDTMKLSEVVKQGLGLQLFPVFFGPMCVTSIAIITVYCKCVIMCYDSFIFSSFSFFFILCFILCKLFVHYLNFVRLLRFC